MNEQGTVVEIDYVYLSKEESNSTIHDDNSILSTSTTRRQSPPEKCTSFCNRVLERNISDKSIHRSRNFFHKFFFHERKEKQTGYSYENIEIKHTKNENIFQKILRGLKEHLCGKIFQRVKRNMSKLLRH